MTISIKGRRVGIYFSAVRYSAAYFSIILILLSDVRYKIKSLTPEGGKRETRHEQERNENDHKFTSTFFQVGFVLKIYFVCRISFTLFSMTPTSLVPPPTVHSHFSCVSKHSNRKCVYGFSHSWDFPALYWSGIYSRYVPCLSSQLSWSNKKQTKLFLILRGLPAESSLFYLLGHCVSTGSARLGGLRRVAETSLDPSSPTPAEQQRQSL